MTHYDSFCIYPPVLLLRYKYTTIPDIINHSVRQKCFDIIEKAVSMCVKHIYDFGEITSKGVGLVNKRESYFGLLFSKETIWKPLWFAASKPGCQDLEWNQFYFQATPPILKGSKWWIGNGASTDFWFHPWLSDILLIESTPLLLTR